MGACSMNGRLFFLRYVLAKQSILPGLSVLTNQRNNVFCCDVVLFLLLNQQKFSGGEIEAKTSITVMMPKCCGCDDHPDRSEKEICSYFGSCRVVMSILVGRC